MSSDEFRAILDQHGITQVGFAHMMGVDGRTVRRWVAGDKPLPGCVALMLRLWTARPEVVSVVQQLSK